MREAVGGLSIFQIVIVLILLFTGIMCLTINHSKAFGVKDEIITIIENENLGGSNNINSPSFGYSNEMKEAVKNQLIKSGYYITGECPDGYDGYDRNGNLVNGKASYCIRANRVEDKYLEDAKKSCKNNVCQITENEFPKMVYYDVILFFQLDIPIINTLFNFQLKGSTKVIFGSV